MPLKTPYFWQHRGFIARMIMPFSALYFLGHKLKTCLSSPYKSPLPVVCIGGVVAGGSGKTPALHAVLKLLREHTLCENPVILTRGYGGIMQGPTAVSPHAHSAKDVGDEALLHTAYGNVIVSANRAHGAKLAESMGADLILMDDGLQNNSLEKTISFLVVDAEQGLGNGYMIPAGPLREPLNDALSRCVAIIQTNGKGDLVQKKTSFKTDLKIISSHDKTIPYFAFAGIGHPEKFKRTLEQHGFSLTGFKSYADHHAYNLDDLDELLRLSQNARLITTAKDFVKIPESYQERIEALEIELVFENEDDVVACLKKGLGR